MIPIASEQCDDASSCPIDMIVPPASRVFTRRRGHDHSFCGNGVRLWHDLEQSALVANVVVRASEAEGGDPVGGTDFLHAVRAGWIACVLEAQVRDVQIVPVV